MNIHPARLLFFGTVGYLLVVFFISPGFSARLLPPGPTTIAGRISQDPLRSGIDQQFEITPEYIRDGESWILVPQERVQVYTLPNPAFQYGDYVVATGTIAKKKHGLGNILQNPKLIPVQIPTSFLITKNIELHRAMYATRDWLLGGLKAALPEPHAAFVAGVLVGSRSALSDDIKNDFARTSTSHIIAVSGYNITIIAGLVSWLALLIMSRKRAFWLVVSVLILFMILTGGQASVVRATIMGVVVFLAQRVGRLPTPLHTLVLTAGMMVALDPTILRYDVGFQLSFLATLGILVVSPVFDEIVPVPKHGEIPKIIRETFIMTVSAQLCVIPLIMFYFQSFSILSLPVNLIVLPFVPLMMILGFVTGIVGALIPLLGRFVGLITTALSYAMLGVIHTVAGISWSSITVSISWEWMFFLYVIFAGAISILKLACEKRKTSIL